MLNDHLGLSYRGRRTYAGALRHEAAAIAYDRCCTGRDDPGCAAHTDSFRGQPWVGIGRAPFDLLGPVKFLVGQVYRLSAQCRLCGGTDRAGDKLVAVSDHDNSELPQGAADRAVASGRNDLFRPMIRAP